MVYVNEIVIMCDDYEGIKALFQNFQTKNLGPLHYFLGIEVAQSKLVIIISQGILLIFTWRQVL